MFPGREAGHQSMNEKEQVLQVMKVVKCMGICLLVCGLTVAWKPMRGLAQQSSGTSKMRDGQHDFDFHVGQQFTKTPLTFQRSCVQMQTR
jgi:hypothetical protein